MKLQRVLRWDPTARLFRVCRLVWERGTVGDGTGYSAKLTLALAPRLIRFRRESDGWILTICGLRVHSARSYGGRFA
jgi:hypothetical protein